MQADFKDSIECLSRHGVQASSLWRAKVDEVGLSTARKILDDNGVAAVSLCAGGLFADGSKTAVEDNKRWIDEALALGADSLVVISGGLSEGDRDLAAARDRVIQGLSDIVPYAQAQGMRLALEPLHPMVCGFRSVISSLGDALDILDAVDADDTLGVAVDSYALWWDPGLESQIQRASSRVLNFHASDWLRETRDVREDRGMIGDGCIDNRLIRSWLERAGFDGFVEVEIFSALDWWKRPIDDVVSTIVARAGATL